MAGTCPVLEESFENQDIFGIPVILYMAVMSNIDISQRATKPEIYDRIFAERGGIFDRFSCEGIAYSEGAHILRNAENSKKYLEFLQNVAFWMFEENSLSLCLEEEDIPELEFDGEQVKILEFPIRYLFENKESEIEFIHKLIYEYFVAEYLFTGIREGQAKGKAEALAGELADMLRENIVSSEILEYLSYRLAKWEREDKARRAQEKLPFKIARRSFCKDLLKEAFFCMLENGMCCFSGERSRGGICQELTVFENMLKLCKMLQSPGEPFVIKPQQEFVTYLAHLRIQKEKLHLANVDLSGAVFKDLSLKNISFERVNLSGATFDSADLSGARFCQTNMSGAVFHEVSLDRAEFLKADLTNTIFQKSELQNIKVKESNLKTVFQNCRLQGSQICRSDIKQLDFSGSDIKHIQFIKDRIARESPFIFKNTVVDIKLLLELERLFRDIVQDCRVDMCDNLLTYAEYCRFREKRQGELQKEILDLLEAGKNYSEWEG